MRVGIIAGEPSGDALGAALITALRERLSNAEFEGIAGTRMIAEGCRTLFPLERLSVLGLTEVVRHLPDLIRIRRSIVRHFLDNPPDVLIGIDAPDFNLGLERRVRRAGILSCHFVSPTVWAWRQGRIRGIGRSVDLMLTMFPFEADFYRVHDVPVCFVGHPLADQIPLDSPRGPARASLDIGAGVRVVTLLPGSRRREVLSLAADLIDTARWLKSRLPDLIVLIPTPGPELKRLVLSFVNSAENWIRVVVGSTHGALAAADACMVASGTATMEAAFTGRPFVVVYRVSPLSYALFRRMLKVPYVAMPNIYAGRELAAEFLQNRVRPDLLGPAVLALIETPAAHREAMQAFSKMHRELRRDSARTAARAILDLVAQGARSPIRP